MASGNDIKAATETYNGFIKAATWSTGVIIVIAALVVGLIASLAGRLLDAPAPHRGPRRTGAG